MKSLLYYIAKAAVITAIAVILYAIYINFFGVSENSPAPQSKKNVAKPKLCNIFCHFR